MGKNEKAPHSDAQTDKTDNLVLTRDPPTFPAELPFPHTTDECSEPLIREMATALKALPPVECISASSLYDLTDPVNCRVTLTLMYRGESK